MNSSTKLLFHLAAPLVAFGLHAHGASVALTYDFDSLRNSGGNVLTTSCVAVFIADSDGDGSLPTAAELLGITLEEAVSVAGDKIFSVDLTSGAFGPQNHAGTITVDYTQSGISESGGTIWGMYWFPTITSLSSAPTLTAGTSYGYFRSSTRDEAAVAAFTNSDYSGMTFPKTGVSTTEVGFFDEDIIVDAGETPTVNTPTIEDFSATYSVIPEPSVVTLSGLAALLCLRRRRG